MLQRRVQAVRQSRVIEPRVKRLSRIAEQGPQQTQRRQVAMTAIGPQAFHQALAIFQPAHEVSKKYFFSLFSQANTAADTTLIEHITAQGQTLQNLDQMLT